MSQFSVYRNNNPRTRKALPYLLDIQSELLSQLRTTVVIPLGKYTQLKDQAITKLCPVVTIDDTRFVVLTPQLAGMDRSLLGHEVTSLSGYRGELIDAINLLITGI